MLWRTGWSSSEEGKEKGQLVSGPGGRCYSHVVRLPSAPARGVLERAGPRDGLPAREDAPDHVLEP